MRGSFRFSAVVVGVFALLPLAAAADDKDDALKLAQRVASRGGYVDAVVRLHAPPADLPASIPLPHVPLLGSVVEHLQRGWASAGRTIGGATTFYVMQPTMLYYDAPAGRDTAITAYEAALRQAGWKPTPDIRRRLLPQGGFQMNPFATVKQWCAPDEKTALSITNGTDSTDFDLTLLSSGPSVNLQCSGSPAPIDAFPQRSPLPTFSAPSGIAITNAGPASDGSTTGARITSSLGIAAVFESFAKQLRDAGWTAGASASSSGVRSQTFAKSADGTRYVALLSIYPLDATHYVALADVSAAAQ